MDTKKLLLFILIGCVVIKNDADEMPLEETYETNQTQNEESEENGESSETGSNGYTNAYSKKTAFKYPKKLSINNFKSC